jgi:ribonuclease HI
MVHHLLAPNKKEWDIEKINSLFPSDLVRDILAVPLLPLVREDKLIWSEENDGIYSVRTGYRKLMKDINKGYGPHREVGWSSIWKIRAPPKVKHLLWRICRDCVPTRVRLRSRCVQCPIECPLCLTHEEDECHLFFNCGAVRDAWNAMELSHIIQPRLHMFTNPKELIFDICMQESDISASRTATLMWFIWQNRNNKVWNDSSSNAHQLGIQAATYWNQWAAVNGLLADQQQRVQPVITATNIMQWQQPTHRYLKCNVDASFFTAAASTGCGWVLRDYRGHFKLAGTNIVPSPFSVLEGEAMALLQAMEEVTQRGLSYVLFESDSKFVVDAISSRQVGVSEFSILISQIQNLLRTNNYFEVKYVNRQANKVAHSLARAAFSMSRRSVYDSIPRCIETCLSNEIC